MALLTHDVAIVTPNGPETGLAVRAKLAGIRACLPFLTGSALLIALSLFSTVQAQPLGESALKAAFLYNFSKFVEWPDQALPRESNPFTICLAGDPRMAEATDQFIKDKHVHGRPVVARAPSSVKDVTNCHLLFIAASARHFEEVVTNGAAALPILTVGESDQFLAQGGIIKLFVEDGRMRFEISPQAAERAQLKISSKLLTLGKIVDSP
jgi:hypothetical protein